MSRDDTTHSRTITSADDMHTFAATIAARLQPADVLLLYGDLGAGKTTFVQGVARALGVAEAVTSPTFTIVGEYTTGHPAIAQLVHIDLYRLSSDTAAHDPAVRDLVGAPPQDAVVLVEWAERIAWPAGERVFSVHFTHGAQANERTVVLDAALVSAAL